MATESARAVPNAKHTHDFTVPAASLTTSNFSTTVYALTATIAGAAPDDAADGGTATTVARGDHRHAAPCAAPGSIAPDDAAAEGNSTSFARANHVHGITCGTPAALTKTATSAESSGTGFARDAHVHATSALPWGLVAQQTLTTSDTTRTADATTDMALNNVSVVQGRRYMIAINGLGDLSAATGSWQLNLHVNGTYVDTFSRITNEAAGAARHPINGIVYWTAPTTQATDDFTVVADERTGTADLTLVGGTDATSPPRTFTIIDIGVAV